jgi:hypothetical protein
MLLSTLEIEQNVSNLVYHQVLVSLLSLFGEVRRLFQCVLLLVELPLADSIPSDVVGSLMSLACLWAILITWLSVTCSCRWVYGFYLPASYVSGSVLQH